MRLLLRCGRVLSLVFFSVLGASLLMYLAPGYFTEAGEMDVTHAQVARANVSRLTFEQHSAQALLSSEWTSWSHGDLGRSRQFGIPVTTLLKQRARQTITLLLTGTLGGWALAILLAFLLSVRDGRILSAGVTGLTAVLLSLPVGLLAVVCLLGNFGGPVLVMATVIAARDLKILCRIFGSAWRAPHVVYAHASGLSQIRIFQLHILPNIRQELIAVAIMSITLALSTLVPIEVIFDTAGLGQLAWSAAMNRDLPVLVAVTGLMSLCVGLAGFALDGSKLEEAACA